MAELSEGETEADLVRQLRQIAGVDEGQSEFFVSINGGPSIWVQYSSGSGSNVAFSVPYGKGPIPANSEALAAYRSTAGGAHRAYRPMQITLRRENNEDLQAKEKGINVEHQTNDPRFDSTVYIDSEARDETLHYVLSSPVLRQAVLTLLDESATRVVLDDESGSIKTSIFTFAHKKHDETRARRILEALDAIARNAPPVEHSNEEPPPDPQRAWLAVVGGVAGFFFFLGLPLYFALVPSRCWVGSSDGEGASLNCEIDGCCTPITPGAVIGVVLGSVLAPLVASRIRGRSDSANRRGVALVSVWVNCFALSMITVGVYYWHFRR
ncbi:MAG: hypothetical protein U0269_00720 [Polyangiales bacterium]